MPSLLRVPRLNPTLVPAVPVEVDWGHPLAQGLVSCWTLAGDVADIGLQPGVGTFDAGKFGTSARGIVVGGNGAGGLAHAANGPKYGTNNQFTLASIINITSLSGDGSIITKTFGNMPGPFDWRVNSSAVFFLIVGNSSSYNPIGGSISIPLGMPLSCVARWNKTSGLYAQFYIDGKLFDTGYANWATPDLADSTDPVRFGGRADGNGKLNGSMAGAKIYDRALSDDLCLWLSREPFAMLRPIQPRRRFVAGGLPGLTADFAYRLAPAVLSADASLAISAAGAATLAPASLAAAAGLAIAADAAATLAGAPLAASAASAISIDAAATLAAVALGADATSTIAADAAVTMPPASLSAVAASAIAASFASGLALATLSATVTVIIGAVVDFSAAIPPATLSAAVTSAISAGAAITLGPVLLEADAASVISADAAVTFARPALSASAASAIDAGFAAALAAATLSGTITLAGALVWPATVRPGRSISIPAARRSVSVPAAPRSISIPDE